MLKRIITSVVALGIFIPVLIFSETWIFPISMAFAATVGTWEMLSCIGVKKRFHISLPLCAVAAFMPLFSRYAFISTNVELYDFLKLSVGIAFIAALYIFGVAVFDNKRVAVNDAGLIFASCFYIISAFTCLVHIHDNIPNGKYIYLLAFMCAWITDAFAYFVGRLLGKHKLIPSISPKKTVEGAIGGLVFCVITMLAFGFVIEKFFNPDGLFKANYLILAISGLFISIVSQIGDLIMSAIKRHYGIKDYGKLFPGHGGILDRFDSVIAVSLILAFICTYFNLFKII